MLPTAWTQRETGASLFTDRLRASLVVVFLIQSEQVAKVPLANHNDIIQAFPPDRADQPFNIAILPRRTRRRRPVTNAHRLKAADEHITVDGNRGRAPSIAVLPSNHRPR